MTTEVKKSSQTSEPAVQEEQALAPIQKDAATMPRTMGEKAVGWLNEVGINWFANVGISLVLTKFYNEKITKKESVKTFFNDWAEKSVGKAKSNQQEDLQEHAVAVFNAKRVKMDIAETIFMCISGTALMFPYKAIKDNAQKLSYQFDRKFEQWGWQKKGTAEAKAAARGESMDHPTENKVSWGDLLISRATSIAVAIFAGTVLEKHATGDWFSKIHSKAADKVEPDITFTDDTKTQVKDIKDIVHSRGQNFKHLSLKAGRSLANSLKDTWFGKWRNITATDDDLIAKPSNTEDFTRLIIKEATLTAVLAATMPVVLDALDWMRGKKKNVSPSATITTHTQIKADITIDSKSTAGAAKTAEKELVKEALIDIAEQPKVLKHTDRTAQKPHSDILPRKEQSVDTMAMAGGV